SSCDLALGHDWLNARNPDIDWRAGTIRPHPTPPISDPSASGEKNSHACTAFLAPMTASTLQGQQDIHSLAASTISMPMSQPSPVLPAVSPRPSVSIVGAAAFVELINDSPLLVGSVTPRKPEELAAAAASLTQNALTDTEDLPAHIPACYHDYADVFSKAKADVLPVHRSYDHTIELEPNTTVPYGPIYRLSEVELAALRDFLDEYQAKGFIRPSKSPAGAPILFVKKKDGSLRLCVDYRGLNAITRKDRYPLPRIDELLDRLRSGYIFSKLDLRSGYNLIRMREGAEWKTAFRPRYGSFEFLVLHFGLTNAPATFQHFMNDTFCQFLDDFLEGYLDDLIVFTALELGIPLPPSLAPEDNPKHVEQVRTILQTMRENGLFANPKKCVFHVRTIDFLGYIVSPEGLSMDPAKTKVIAAWPTPTSVKEVQSFLGFANFYRRFIAQYSAIVKPLTNLTRKEVPFVWDSACERAFIALKCAFTSAPILAHFHPDRPIVLETDASDYAVAAVLSQENPDT